MTNSENLKQLLGDIDIYLLDQIVKQRYNQDDKILDAGCGNGRNMHWFLNNEYDITGIDINEESITALKSKYAYLPQDRLLVSTIEKTEFPDSCFNHIICSAVLHFADNLDQFNNMMDELIRVLKPGGSIFIRMTTAIGFENKIEEISEGLFYIPDGSKRFLLTRSILANCLATYNLALLEPLKTVFVDDIRSMCTLMLQKREGEK